MRNETSAFNCFLKSWYQIGSKIEVEKTFCLKFRHVSKKKTSFSFLKLYKRLQFRKQQRYQRKI